jgi:hypothetical protein
MKYDVTHILTSSQKECQRYGKGHLEIRKNENKTHQITNSLLCCSGLLWYSHCIVWVCYGTAIVLFRFAMAQPLCCSDLLWHSHCVVQVCYGTAIVLFGFVMVQPLCCSGLLWYSHCVVQVCYGTAIVLLGFVMVQPLCCSGFNTMAVP